MAHNLVHNSPVNVDDINCAEQVFGPAAPLFQGKMRRRTPLFGGKHKKLPLPLQILDRHKFVEIHVNLFFVNKLPFLHTKSAKVQFLTIEHVNSRGAKNINAGLNAVC